MHKVFVSYYHKDDQLYRDKFETLFKDTFISKSVKPGDINTNVGDEYVKRLIQEEYLTDTSVLVVLIGNNTFCRKHVDWEISGALDKRIKGYSGLLGILLPTFRFDSEDKYSYSDIPSRLADNIKSGYAHIYKWTENTITMKNIIEKAFNDRVDKSNYIDNSRKQMQSDLCE